jgi:hypothetical protein
MFLVEIRWKGLQYPTVGELLSELWSVYLMKFYKAVKHNICGFMK